MESLEFRRPPPSRVWRWWRRRGHPHRHPGQRRRGVLPHREPHDHRGHDHRARQAVARLQVLQGLDAGHPVCVPVSLSFAVGDLEVEALNSMGGHGALTMALRSPDKFKSVSAFAPICSPINCPWGQKALAGYLGPESGLWRQYDACALIEDGARVERILVDQGDADGFLQEQLKPQLLQQACAAAGVDLNMRMQVGFDHSYYFVATFIEDHLRWHAEHLLA